MERDAFGRPSAPPSGAAPSPTSVTAPAPAPSAVVRTWWFWVRPKLLTTRFELGDDAGEWVGDFDRRGAGGRRALARDAARDDILLRLGPRAEQPTASYAGQEQARIADGRLALGGRLFDLHLPRDATFTCDVHHGEVPLLAVRRATDGPFARLDVAPSLPDPALVALLVLFVLTYDHDEANTMPGGGS